jgi:hypothetical protein
VLCSRVAALTALALAWMGGPARAERRCTPDPGALRVASQQVDDGGGVPQAARLADVDGDGTLDLVIVNGGSAIRSTRPALGVLAGRADRTFAAPSWRTITAEPEPMGHDLVIADVDGDGQAEAVVASSLRSHATLHALSPRGPAKSAAPIRFGSGTSSQGLAVADLDGDGHADLVAALWGQDVVVVAFGGGSRRLSLPTGASPRDLVLADLDGDGHLDLAVAGDGSIAVMLAGADRGFARRKVIKVGRALRALVAADLDGDGLADLVASDDASAELTWLRNGGKGAFGRARRIPVGKRPADDAGSRVPLAVADLDGDGCPDLARASYWDRAVWVSAGLGGGRFAPARRYELAAQAELLAQPRTLVTVGHGGVIGRIGRW